MCLIYLIRGDEHALPVLYWRAHFRASLISSHWLWLILHPVGLLAMPAIGLEGLPFHGILQINDRCSEFASCSFDIPRPQLGSWHVMGRLRKMLRKFFGSPFLGTSLVPDASVQFFVATHLSGLELSFSHFSIHNILQRDEPAARAIVYKLFYLPGTNGRHLFFRKIFQGLVLQLDFRIRLWIWGAYFATLVNKIHVYELYALYEVALNFVLRY